MSHRISDDVREVGGGARGREGRLGGGGGQGREFSKVEARKRNVDIHACKSVAKKNTISYNKT